MLVAQAAETYAQWHEVTDALRDRRERLGELLDAAHDVLTYPDGSPRASPGARCYAVG